MPCVEPESARKTSHALSRALKRDPEAWWVPKPLPTADDFWGLNHGVVRSRENSRDPPCVV